MLEALLAGGSTPDRGEPLPGEQSRDIARVRTTPHASLI
jgi:hypothetical protein